MSNDVKYTILVIILAVCVSTIALYISSQGEINTNDYVAIAKMKEEGYAKEEIKRAMEDEFISRMEYKRIREKCEFEMSERLKGIIISEKPAGINWTIPPQEVKSKGK